MLMGIMGFNSLLSYRRGHTSMEAPPSSVTESLDMAKFFASKVDGFVQALQKNPFGLSRSDCDRKLIYTPST